MLYLEEFPCLDGCLFFESVNLGTELLDPLLLPDQLLGQTGAYLSTPKHSKGES